MSKPGPEEQRFMDWYNDNEDLLRSMAISGVNAISSWTIWKEAFKEGCRAQRYYQFHGRPLDPVPDEAIEIFG